MNDDVLQSIDVQRRRTEKEKLRQQQSRKMESGWADRQSNDYDRSVSATNDNYMKDALSKVRESKVTHSETLTRMNGTWMHNQKMKD